MRKFLIILMLMFFTINTVFASKIPQQMQSYIEKTFPKTDFRFDGLIILPDNTMYLPLFPAETTEQDDVLIKKTFPENKTLSDKPEIIVFNNNYVLLKVIKDKSNQSTVFVPKTIPDEIRNGLLPQDMLVPRGLVIPEVYKGIIGNLNISLAKDPGLRVSVPQSKNPSSPNVVVPIPELKNKTFYIATGYSKNIQVVNSENKSPAYALTQNYVPKNIKGYQNKFLLVTSFGSDSLSVISLADEAVIKEILFTSEPDEILIDNEKELAYVSCPEESSIFIVNLETMTLSKQIKINGMCERLTLSNDGTKIFYADKKTNEIWAIELDNNYLLKDIGRFPNVSRIAYDNQKLYIISRTKNHIAIIDYPTNGLIAELKITPKPVDLIAYENNLFVLGAEENNIMVINTLTDEITDSLFLNTNGFSTNITPINSTSLAIISDSKASVYCVLDMKKKQIVKTSAIEVPIRAIVVTDKIKK